MAIEGLTAWLDDGDQIEFDGSTGRVWRLAEAEEISTELGSLARPAHTTALSIDTEESALTTVTS
jgi:hypothetical protein